MTEADYQLECSRAELLGLPKPDRNDFFSKQIEVPNEENAEEIAAEEIEDAGVRREGFQRIGGGLEELSTILSSTQKKLNRFKAVCGSFSNLLKLQIGAKKEENDFDTNSCVAINQDSGEETMKKISASQTKKEGNLELDKLDSLISKAEKAELSLSSQNKQMKKFLN